MSTRNWFFPTERAGLAYDEQVAPDRARPDPLPAPVIAAGDSSFGHATRHRPAVWLAFSCAEHVGHLDVARPAHRPGPGRDHAAPRALPGPPPDPQQRVRWSPGEAARELVAQARRWAAAHPGRTYPPAAGPGSPG